MSSASQAEQRRLALNARRSLDDDERRLSSRRITRTFIRSPLFTQATHIGCFLSLPDEVDTGDILEAAWRASKRIYCPVVAARRRLRFVEVTRETGLRRSAFGLLEPEQGEEIDPLRLDVVVVPLVAFDVSGNRIGMGGGYYDRTFRALAKRRRWQHPKLVGVAFECQKTRKIKANPWDIGLFKVLTETA